MFKPLTIAACLAFIAASAQAGEHKAWTQYCASTHLAPVDLCAPHEPATFKLTDDAWPDIHRIWQTARRGFYLRPEPKGQDVWRYPDNAADCEDVAIWAMAELVRIGVPRGALTFAITEVWGGEYHVVVNIHTDRGVLELDILDRNLRMAMAGERSLIHKSQRQGDPSQWLSGGQS